jgi:hypothetical protein
MRFKRFFAILLLLLLPLQSSFAALDFCCAFDAKEQVSSAQQAGSELGDEANCCAQCDFCNHSSLSFFTLHATGQLSLPGAAPVARPEVPFHSFIPDVPSRPDLAAATV